jgi:hypothetical protein
MGALVTLTQLQNAAVDTEALAAIVNGGPLDPPVATRTGPAVPTIASVAAGGTPVNFVILIDQINGSHWKLTIADGAPVYTAL